MVPRLLSAQSAGGVSNSGEASAQIQARSHQMSLQWLGAGLRGPSAVRGSQAQQGACAKSRVLPGLPQEPSLSTAGTALLLARIASSYWSPLTRGPEPSAAAAVVILLLQSWRPGRGQLESPTLQPPPLMCRELVTELDMLSFGPPTSCGRRDSAAPGSRRHIGIDMGGGVI